MNGRKLDIKKAVPRANNNSHRGKNNYHNNRGVPYSQSHRGPPISGPGPSPYHNSHAPVAIIPSINPYDPHQRPVIHQPHPPYSPYNTAPSHPSINPTHPGAHPGANPYHHPSTYPPTTQSMRDHRDRGYPDRSRGGFRDRDRDRDRGRDRGYRDRGRGDRDRGHRRLLF